VRRSLSSVSNILTCDIGDVPIPSGHLCDFIWSREEQYGSNTALVDGVTRQSLTLSETHSLSRCFGSSMVRLGSQKGDVLALVLPNCPEFPIVFTGAAGVGVTITTINPTYTAGEIGGQLKNSGAKYLVTIPALLPKMLEAVDGKGISIIVTGDQESNLHLSLNKMLKDSGDLYPTILECNQAEDVVVLPYSSGTTGVPKGVMLTHKNLVSNMAQLDAPGLDFMDREGTTLCVLPYFHIFGLNVTMTNMLFNGGNMITLPSFDPALFLKLLVEERPTFLHLAPPLVGFLANHPMVTPDHLTSVHTVLVGAAPVGPALIEQALLKGPHIKFREGYGMSELSPVVCVTKKNKIIPGSTGNLIPNTKMKVVDLSSGEALGIECTGELCFQGPQVMPGYLNNPKATNETIIDGWLHSGDIGYYDKDGNVFIVDRLKELIKVKGLQVAPAELEDLIRGIPGVKDVAVIGIDDAKAGEVPRAYVVKDDAELTEDSVKENVAGKLSAHKHLAGGVEFIQEIPKSAAGKILRKDLKEAYNKRK